MGEAEAAHLVGREERRPLIRRRPIHFGAPVLDRGREGGGARDGGGEREARRVTNCESGEGGVRKRIAVTLESRD